MNVNIHKKILFIVLTSLSSLSILQAAIPCGNAIPGVLRVGILPGNLPYSDVNTAGNAIGFDSLLAQAVAQVLGYSSVQFTGFGSSSAAQAALTAGTIDVYANSATNITPPSAFIGVVTDISDLGISSTVVYGWQLNPACCALARRIELAVNQIVGNGQYAQILQTLRLNGQTGGLTLGVPSPGFLLQPFPFASSEVGTIPATCLSTGPVSLPATNCISAFLAAGCTITTTTTGVTGVIPS